MKKLSRARIFEILALSAVAVALGTVGLRTSTERKPLRVPASSDTTTGVRDFAIVVINAGPEFPAFGAYSPEALRAKVTENYKSDRRFSLDGYWKKVSRGKLRVGKVDVFGPFDLRLPAHQLLPKAFCIGSRTESPEAISKRVQRFALEAAGIPGAAHDDLPRFGYTDLHVVINAGYCKTVVGKGADGREDYHMTGDTLVGVARSFPTLISTTGTPLDGERGIAALLVHEAGHDLGLNHASRRVYPSENEVGAVGAPFTTVEYGDCSSPMGCGRGSYNAVELARLGWLDEGEIEQVESDRVVTINPIHSEASGKRAIQVRRGDTNTFFWIQYQPAMLVPAHPGEKRRMHGEEGASILIEDSATVESGFTHALNFRRANRPELRGTDAASRDADWQHPTLTPEAGEWTDRHTGTRLQVISASPDRGLTVRISYDRRPDPSKEAFRSWVPLRLNLSLGNDFDNLWATVAAPASIHRDWSSSYQPRFPSLARVTFEITKPDGSVARKQVEGDPRRDLVMRMPWIDSLQAGTYLVRAIVDGEPAPLERRIQIDESFIMNAKNRAGSVPKPRPTPTQNPEKPKKSKLTPVSEPISASDSDDDRRQEDTQQPESAKPAKKPWWKRWFGG